MSVWSKAKPTKNEKYAKSAKKCIKKLAFYVFVCYNEIYFNLFNVLLGHNAVYVLPCSE